MRQLILLTAWAALAGCASAPFAPCGSGEQPATSDLLYFGTAKPNGVVSAQEWAQFLERTVTPRFPQGLSVWPASGQWPATTATSCARRRMC